MEEIAIKLLIPLALMVFLLLLNLPIYISILAATCYMQFFVNNLSLESSFTTLYHGIARPSLLAIPFFIIAGNFIDASRMGERIINMFMPLLGRFKGGMALTGVLTNGFFGAISGSAAAAAATLGKLTYKPIVESSGEKMALGVICCAGGLASIIPPSISLILFGIATEQSIGRLFMAGFIPGILIMVILGIYVVIASPRPQAKLTMEHTRVNILQNLPVLLMPVVVLGGIYAGFFTPTEAGAVAAVYALVVPLFYRELTFKTISSSLLEGVVTTGRLFILVASSLALAEALTLSGVVYLINDLFGGLSVFAFLAIMNVIMLIAGCFFDSGAIILILAPIITPVAVQLGIDPIHLGIIVTINVAVGMFTPPFGLNIFVVQGVLSQPFEKIVVSNIPFVILYLVALVIVMSFPSLSTWLPSILM